MNDDGPQTREEWIENNKAVAAGEGDTDMFTVEIETRLGLDQALRTEADEALGDAYVACLATYEGQQDQEYYHSRGEAPPWAPLTAANLVSEYGITPEEANEVVKMAAQEYEGK